MRYFIELSYHGKGYHGWQKQKNAHTVQQQLNTALEICLRTGVDTVGSGRTDTGVHARQQFCHLDFQEILDTDHTVYKLNKLLPSDIAIIQMYPVSETAHARFDAVSRSYHYQIHHSKDPFLTDTSYHFRKELATTAMNEACALIMGSHDFKSFCKSGASVDHYQCTVTEAKWSKHNGRHHFYVSANRFLRGMVRALVGTMLEVGTGKLTVREFQDILGSGDRRSAGKSAPARGLFLTEVSYPEHVLKAD